MTGSSDGNRLRVLYITPAAILGGAEVNLLAVLHQRQFSGFEPAAVLLPKKEGPLVSRLEEMGIRVGYIDYYSWQRESPWRYAQTLTQLLIWIRRTRPHVIHLNHQGLVEYLAQLGRITGLPTVCHIRNAEKKSFWEKNGKWLKYIDSIIVESDAELKSLEAVIGIKRKIVQINSGIDIERFQSPENPSHLREHFAVPDDAFVVGFIARLIPEKGPEDFIRAAALVASLVESSVFVIVGEDEQQGIYRRRLENLAEELGVRNHVVFTGYCDSTENLLARFDVFVFCSRPQMAEGAPLAVLDAMAAGKIVVATPIAGVVQMIEDGHTGFLAEPSSPMALSEAILRAYHLTPDEKMTMRMRAIEKVRKSYDVARQIDQLSQLYLQLHTKHSGGHK